jgi:hypothetical protein
MRTARYKARLVLVGLFIAMLITADAAEREPVCVGCPTILIDAQTFSAEERQLLRAGVADAIGFFRAHGVELKQTIQLTKRYADHGDPLPHIGAYSLQRNRIRLLGLEQSLNRDRNYRLFGLPIDEALYKTVVVHEIAHAIADQNFTMPNPSLVAQEYLAYVAQLSTMPSPLRERVLGGFDLAPYESIDEMSPVYYQLAPTCFGVKAYRHFLGLPDQTAFLHGLLSGRLRPPGSEME